jgi:ABC-2 type transport system permease protein
MTWIAVTFGLFAKSIEGAGVFSYLLMLLIFTSSAFAPTETMPAALRYFAKYQPMTPIIESVRSLLIDGTIDKSVWVAIVWCVGIWIVFHIAAMRIYKGRVS